jgi:3-phosphoshikimate 1-carboxyvinyltransferase
MTDAVVSSGVRAFDLVAPGDKSISHRALILAALADGESRLRRLAPGDDVARTRACLEQLGVRIYDADDHVVVEGRAGELDEPSSPLDCGNSGTTMRLLAGVLAGAGVRAILDGDDSLRRRPMSRVIRPLREMGAVIEAREGRAPLSIERSSLRARDIESEVASAQVKGAVLLAGLYCDGTTRVRLPSATRDHTERMLAPARVVSETAVEVDGPSLPLQPLGDFTVPGDPSAAFALVAAAALGGSTRVRGVSLARGRTGALDVLREMGAELVEENAQDHATGLVADLVLQGPATLRAFDVGADRVPSLIDELPLLALLATQAIGSSRIRGAGELRHKESDRIAALAAGLRALGADVDEREDGLDINGPTGLSGGAVDPRRDHRLAITFAIAATATTSDVVIEDAACVRASWPAFFTVLESAGERR